MPITHQSQIETSISKTRESAYSVPVLGSSAFRRIINESPQVASKTLNFEDDAGYENGTDLAIDTWATTADTSFELSPKLNFQDIGYQLDMAFGGYSVSGAGPYTHVFTPQSMNTSRQLPSRTGLKKYGGLRSELFPGLVCSKLTISGNKMGRLTTSQSLVGSGGFTKNPAGYTSPAIGTNLEYAYAGQASIMLNTTAGVATAASQVYSCDLESWTLEFDNPAADDGYRQCSPYIIAGIPESGQTRSEMLVGARSYMFSFQARDLGTDKAEDWMRAGTIVDLNIPIFGTATNAHQLRFQHTRARIVQANPITGAGGDFIGIDGQVRLLASAAGDGSIPFSATLVNSTPSYLS